MINKIKKYYNAGWKIINDPFHIKALQLDKKEVAKTPLRSDIINFLLVKLNRETTYLEIGVRNPADNYDKINSTIKYSVDPGIEYKENPVDFKLTSDDFFSQLKNGKILNQEIKFDVIFIDGLHLAEQVDRDIQNALDFIKDDGFIVLHDCNPPSEWHAREEHNYRISPAGGNWNGTTWKAFVKWRQNKDLFSCCIDTDWGIGILSKTQKVGEFTTVKNEFYEFHKFKSQRVESLNLITFEELKKLLK